MVDVLEIRPFFEALVSAARLPGKPDPAVFLLAAERLGVTPAHSLVMEDAPAGSRGRQTRRHEVRRRADHPPRPRSARPPT